MMEVELLVCMGLPLTCAPGSAGSASAFDRYAYSSTLCHNMVITMPYRSLPQQSLPTPTHSTPEPRAKRKKGAVAPLISCIALIPPLRLEVEFVVIAAINTSHDRCAAFIFIQFTIKLVHVLLGFGVIISIKNVITILI